MIIEEPSLLMFMGRLHPLVLHFPVALLMLAALLELIQKFRKTEYGTGYNQTLWLVLIFGSLSAVAAASMGYILASSGDYAGETVYWHKRFGMAVAGLSILAVFIKYLAEAQAKTKASKKLANLYGLTLLMCVAAIFTAGHYGGEFGRTPMAQGSGRDHHINSFST